MKKVLLITYYWPPSGGAGVQRWLKFSKYLPEFGYTPIVLTVDEKRASYAQPDYSLLQEISPDLQVHKTDTFEPYNLYRKLSGKKEIPYGGFTNQKKLTFFEKFSRFIRGNLFIPDPRKGWKRYALKKALALIREQKIEVIVTSGPPHSTHLIGRSIQKITGLRWIADFRDPWTDIYYYDDLFHTCLANRYDRYLEKSVLENAHKIVTVSQEVGKLLSDKIPGTHEKIVVIPNGYDDADFDRAPAISNDIFTITYTGTISVSYHIDQLIEAMGHLPAALKNNLKIKFIGHVPEDIIRLFMQNGLGSRVEILGYIPHGQAVSHMKGSSMLLMAIPDTPQNKGIVTGKFFEYLAAGRPILAIGPPGGDLDLMIRECKGGMLFDYHEQEKMKQYIQDAFIKYEQGILVGETKGAEKFTRRNLTRELANIL